jgi:DNA-binding CsgD family transcriptional regulator
MEAVLNTDGSDLQERRQSGSGGPQFYARRIPLARRRVIEFVRDIRPEHAVDDLTPHETRLLKLIADGHNYKTAAIELGVSVNTISFHMRRVYEKLHVHSKSQAVAKALRQRLIR